MWQFGNRGKKTRRLHGTTFYGSNEQNQNGNGTLSSILEPVSQNRQKPVLLSSIYTRDSRQPIWPDNIKLAVCFWWLFFLAFVASQKVMIRDMLGVFCGRFDQKRKEPSG